jgi:hypothetical protein
LRNICATSPFCLQRPIFIFPKRKRGFFPIFFNRFWPHPFQRVRRRDFGGGGGGVNKTRSRRGFSMPICHGLRRVIEGCCWGDSAATLPACFPNYGCQYGQGALQAPAQAKLQTAIFLCKSVGSRRYRRRRGTALARLQIPGASRSVTPEVTLTAKGARNPHEICIIYVMVSRARVVPCNRKPAARSSCKAGRTVQLQRPLVNR